MSSSDDDSDDIAFEEFMELTEAQQDAELDRAMAEHKAWWDTLTAAEQYATLRSSGLRLIAGQRKLIRDHRWLADTGIFQPKIKEAQRRLLKIRIQRSTGIYPGEA